MNIELAFVSQLKNFLKIKNKTLNRMRLHRKQLGAKKPINYPF